MRCLVCGSAMSFYFKKPFNKYGVGDVEYWKCENCGFVSAKTIYEMTDKEWAALNVAYHQAYQGTNENTDDPRWLLRLNSQAKIINDAALNGLIKIDGKWLDYAAGGGSLALS